MRGTVKNKIEDIVKNPIIVLGVSLCSVLGISLSSIFNSKVLSLIALGIFILTLLFLFYSFNRTLNQYLSNRYPSGYHLNTNIIKYSSKDGKIVIYEIFKYLQSKKLVLSNHEHGYKWSGTKKPSLSSEFQEIIEQTFDPTSKKYDRVLLKFKTPLLFNDTGLVHLLFEMDDSDQKSETHVMIKVKDIMELIYVTIEFKYKPDNYSQDAKLYFRPFHSDRPEDFTLVESIPFDTKTKTYHKKLFKPNVEHYYKIVWER